MGSGSGYRPLVTLESLASLGYKIGSWHEIRVYTDKDSRLLIETSFEYMPEGAVYGYERKHEVDGLYEVYYDMDENSLMLRRLDEE